MPPSEIDDIFAGKSTGKKVQTGVTTLSKSSVPVEGKKKKKKGKKTEEADPVQEPTPSKKIKSSKSKDSSEAVIEEAKPESKKRKRSPPQEIVDSSLPAKRRKSDQNTTLPSKKKTGKDDIKKFKDSRGGSGRKRTEEGFLVYTEEELGLGKEGGDTPLCPFDCECCY